MSAMALLTRSAAIVNGTKRPVRMPLLRVSFLLHLEISGCTSPSLEAPTVIPPLAGPSQAVSQPLFEESIMSEVRETRPDIVAPPGMWSLVPSMCSN